MEKMTYVKALTAILNGETMTEEIKMKLTDLRTSLEKKNSTEHKPTAQQVENDGLKTAILDCMEDGKGYTITELMKAVPALEDVSNQRTSALVRQMVEAGLLAREEIKRKAYFSKVGA